MNQPSSETVLSICVLEQIGVYIYLHTCMYPVKRRTVHATSASYSEECHRDACISAVWEVDTALSRENY